MELLEFKRKLSAYQVKCTLPGDGMMSKVLDVNDAEDIGIEYCEAQKAKLAEQYGKELRDKDALIVELYGKMEDAIMEIGDNQKVRYILQETIVNQK